MTTRNWIAGVVLVAVAAVGSGAVQAADPKPAPAKLAVKAKGDKGKEKVAADPAGIWTWSITGRNGETREQKATLTWKDGKLEGTVSGRRGDTAISDGSFKDGTIAFTVVREFNDRKMTSRHEGKLDGDAIKGSISFDRDGEKNIVPWEAKRGAATPATP